LKYQQKGGCTEEEIGIRMGGNNGRLEKVANERLYDILHTTEES
jgi:hypothetical protein